MHLVGISISSWFNNIMSEAIDDYVHKVKAKNESEEHIIVFRKSVVHQVYCMRKSVVTEHSSNAIPYLYPFSIEYNIILATLWYIIWTNIGRNYFSFKTIAK